MKKLISALLVSALLVSLAGCNNGGSDNGNLSANNITSTTTKLEIEMPVLTTIDEVKTPIVSVVQRTGSEETVTECDVSELTLEAVASAFTSVTGINVEFASARLDGSVAELCFSDDSDIFNTAAFANFGFETEADFAWFILDSVELSVVKSISGAKDVSYGCADGSDLDLKSVIGRSFRLFGTYMGSDFYLKNDNQSGGDNNVYSFHDNENGLNVTLSGDFNSTAVADENAIACFWNSDKSVCVKYNVEVNEFSDLDELSGVLGAAADNSYYMYTENGDAVVFSGEQVDGNNEAEGYVLYAAIIGDKLATLRISCPVSDILFWSTVAGGFSISE